MDCLLDYGNMYLCFNQKFNRRAKMNTKEIIDFWVMYFWGLLIGLVILGAIIGIVGIIIPAMINFIFKKIFMKVKKIS